MSRKLIAWISGGAALAAVLAVCCDGRRTGVDAGLELGELA